METVKGFIVIPISDSLVSPKYSFLLKNKRLKYQDGTIIISINDMVQVTNQDYVSTNRSHIFQSESDRRLGFPIFELGKDFFLTLEKAKEEALSMNSQLTKYYAGKIQYLTNQNSDINKFTIFDLEF